MNDQYYKVTLCFEAETAERSTMKVLLSRIPNVGEHVSLPNGRREPPYVAYVVVNVNTFLDMVGRIDSFAVRLVRA